MKRVYSVFFLLFLTVQISILGCEKKDQITHVNFEEQEFAPFVEPEFPFITTSLDARNLGVQFPSMNVTARCIAIQLGNVAYSCFDTDLLRWSVGWTGDFLPMVTMGQISYDDFHNKDNLIPGILGEPKIATGHYSGWSSGFPSFEDPRPAPLHADDPSWGAMPEEIGRYNGLYRTEHGVVLSYSVNGTKIYELPGSKTIGEENYFTRTFRVESSEETLYLIASEIDQATGSEVEPGMATIFHGEDEFTVMKIASDNEEFVSLETEDNQYLMSVVEPHDEPVEFTILIGSGNETKISTIEEFSLEPIEFPDFENGTSNPWSEPIYTRGTLSPDTSAYVVDELTLPIPNPWNRNVRVVDIAFFEDGRAAVVTFEGDVWIVDGINHQLNDLTWRRFASGLYEPQSIEVVDEQIYIFGKEGMVRLHDLNDDGAADYYENFSNLISQSIESREWASDMSAIPGGGFYVAKAGALDMGPAGLSSAIASGFRTGAEHTGVILKISEDGRTVEQYASGFRGPYIGVHPGTGVLTASDQQGHFVPATPLYILEEGDFAGVEATAHRDSIPNETPPLLWIPHEVDRSGTSQVWITSNEMGPLNNQLVHLSYGRPGLFSVLIDSTETGLQGGISVIPAEFTAPTMKGAVHPIDGQLYIAGFSLWGSNSDGVASLSRLRYTGLENTLPIGFQAGAGGLILHFDTELDEEKAKDLSGYAVRRWNYLRSEEYGSGYFKLDGSPGQEQLPVFSAHLSDDQKSIFLVIPNIQEAEQMQLSYQLKTMSGQNLHNDFWFTVHHARDINPTEEGFSISNIDELLASGGISSNEELADRSNETPATAERGEELFMRYGCMGCHTTDGSEGTGVGPTLKGLFGHDVTLTDGTTKVADGEYLRKSILEPGAEIVEGYDEGMPSFLGILSDNEVESIILYIQTLVD